MFPIGERTEDYKGLENVTANLEELAIEGKQKYRTTSIFTS